MDYLVVLYKQLPPDIKNKISICEAFHSILTYTGNEFTLCVQPIFSLLLSLIADEDEQVISKAKENNEILKAKFLFYFEKQSNDQ